MTRYSPIIIACIVCGCGAQKTGTDEALSKPAAVSQTPTLPEEIMERKVAQFAVSQIGVAPSKIPSRHRPVIEKLVAAARIIDGLYLRQVSDQNPSTREALVAAGAPYALEYFDIMYGPWDRLDGNRPFFGGREKPAGAAFYPEDLSPEAFEEWVSTHPEDREAFESYFTIIERTRDGLRAVPYSEAYAEDLTRAAALLTAAADLAEDPRLAAYLRSRAAAFSSNTYRESDIAWMDLRDGDLEVVIGPYEVYEDGLMGLKAAFEAFITLRDPEDSRRLAEIKTLIPEMEGYLPIPDEHKNPNRGAESPISVVDVLFTAGDTRAGVQTLAFNLPNDEVVRERKGSKKVMLKNVAEAKFHQILTPIARRLVQADQLENITFEAFFHHTLIHETAHGLGPGRITVTDADGKPHETTVNQALRDHYSVIEEAKADVLGIYLNYLLIEKGLKNAAFEEQMYASFLGGFFRSVRFGVEEAHGRANLIQFNYLMGRGAVVGHADGRFGYVAAKMREAIRSLARELLMIEALGDFEGAGRFIDRYGTMPPGLAASLARLSDIPTDIRPEYLIETQMDGW